MKELLRTDYLAVTVDERNLVSLAWHKEEPDDEHSVATARKVTAALDAAFAGGETKPPYDVLVDLVCVKKTFPRGTAAYAGWLLSNRSAIRAVAFATKSFLLRAGVSAALLVPGLKAKGFSDAGEAKAFLQKG